MCTGSTADSGPPRRASSPMNGGDFFGWDVAADGDRIGVGVPFHDSDFACSPPDPDCDSGSVRTYVWTGTDWQFESELTALDGAKRDQFGFAVSLSGDSVLVGSVADDDACPPCPVPDPDCCNSGSAYVFTAGMGLEFIRGDANGDGLFNGLTDGLWILNHQFSGGPPPADPYPSCGMDPDPASSLGCDGPVACP